MVIFFNRESVADHNLYRIMLNNGQVEGQPPAKPSIKLLKSSIELAIVAKGHAKRCKWEHSSSGYGENLYLNTSVATLEDAVDSWYNEFKHYNPVTGQCVQNEVCGHYTQIMSDRTTHVGCAIEQCDSMEGLDFGGTFIVCNYSPFGNLVGSPPYTVDGDVHSDLFQNGILQIKWIEYNDKYYDADLHISGDVWSLGFVKKSDSVIGAISANSFYNGDLYLPSVTYNGDNYGVIFRQEDDLFKMINVVKQ